ncbi:uncharacterized protein LOC132192977 [Neocloeon triangulifer]|uniref:uncharacterized protein LOC132192977 n=1 Tax=Neocloeon triangulifer TaxID=2078957 RepID=UPI00286F0995|nr:uncharacterized protein LOC132192977 [Neocloeon triangulifer]
MSPSAPARHAVWIWVFVVCVLGVGQSAHVQCGWWQHCAQQAGHPRPLETIEGSRVAAVGSSAELNGRPQLDGPPVRPTPAAPRFWTVCRSLFMGARRPGHAPCCSGDVVRWTSTCPLCPQCAPQAPDCPHSDSSTDQTFAFQGGAPSRAERRAVAEAAEQQVRNRDVCNSLSKNLPVSIPVPERSRNRDFNFRIPEQQEELTQLKVAPNRTAPNSASMPTRMRGAGGGPPRYGETTSNSLAAFDQKQALNNVKVVPCRNNNKPSSERQFLT